MMSKTPGIESSIHRYEDIHICEAKACFGSCDLLSEQPPRISLRNIKSEFFSKPLFI